MEIKNKNPLVLAYIGDAIYEVYIREYLLELGLEKVNKLQKECIKYVSAKGQAQSLKKLIDNNYLSDEELEIVIRARNHKTNTSPRNTDIITYKYATGLEALIGYLYLAHKKDRLDEIMTYIKER